MLAVEASQIANIARQIAEENKCEHIIEVFQQRIEDFQLPADIDRVDVIISEWMGFYLLHEGMLDSVINARDRFLKPDGAMFPCSATISVAPCTVPDRFSNWNNVDGVRMSSFANALRFQKSQNPEILTVSESHLLHDGTVVAYLDLKDVQMEDLKEIEFREVIVIDRAGRFEGVCMWFDCEFPVDGDGDMCSTVLSTSPKMVTTHWKQTVIVLPEVAHEDVEEKDPIAFSLKMKRNADNARRYTIELEMLDAIGGDEIEHSLPCDCRMTKCMLTKAHLNSISCMDQAMDTQGGAE